MVQHMLQVVDLKNIHLILDDELQQQRMKKEVNKNQHVNLLKQFTTKTLKSGVQLQAIS